MGAAVGASVETDAAGAAACRRLAARYGVGASLVTGGRDGAVLVSADGHLERLPRRARAVFDVSGANDAALATLAAALGRGLDMASVGADELRRAVDEGAGPAARKSAAV